MKIEKIEIRKIFLPYKQPFATSGWTERGNNSIIVKIFADGICGWGEAPVSLHPFYNEETTGTVWNIMKENLIPALFKTNFTEAADAGNAFSSIRGNKIAIASLEFALWDLFGKIKNKSVSQMLGGKRKKIEVGVSIGIQKDTDSLLKLVEEYLNEGYKRIKIKIRPGWDIEPVKEIRRRWENIPLQVDANSAYTLNDAKHLAGLDDFNLLLIEQPLFHDDLYEHSILENRIRTPVCLDESINSFQKAKNAIEMNACKIINIKPARVGGLASAKSIHDLAQENNIPVWCGGMLETGIGKAFNAALASLPNFKLPGDISASKRYFQTDLVLNPFVLNEDGTLTVPRNPGCGAIVDEKFLEKITIEKESLSN